MAHEARLVHGDVLDGDAALLAVHRFHAVDEQEWITVRQQLQNAVDVDRLQGGLGLLVRHETPWRWWLD